MIGINSSFNCLILRIYSEFGQNTEKIVNPNMCSYCFQAILIDILKGPISPFFDIRIINNYSLLTRN